MRPQAPTARVLPARPYSRDSRKIYHPVDIPTVFQTGHRRFQAERPSTVDAHRRQQHLDNGFVADSLSYYPRIRENPSARETREQKARAATAPVIELPRVHRGGEAAQPPFRKRSTVVTSQLRDVSKAAPSLRVMSLDQDGMATLHSAFDGSDRLSEEDFVLQVFKRYNAQLLPHRDRVQLTQELSTMFREADIHSQGYLTWEALSTHLFHTSDVHSLEQAAAICKYQADDVPAPVKLPVEIQGMVLLHDEKQPGFWMLDVATNKVRRQTPSTISTGHIVDAMYWSAGRYIITASTSPVISLYDIDYLKLRQQIPCDGTQVALAGHADASTRCLYSSSTLGQVHVWNLDSLTLSHSFFAKSHHELCTNLVVIDAMDHLAVASLDGKIYMMDLHLLQPVKTLCGHRQGVTVLRYSSENGYIVSGGVDQSIHVWNPHVETKIGSLLGHKQQLIGVEIVPDSPQIVSADESGTVKIWDLRKFSCLQTITREMYVKDQAGIRLRTRPMTTMSYLASKKRIAVAHSVVHFLDESPSKSVKEAVSHPVGPVSSSNTSGLAIEYHEDRDNASRVPVAVIVSHATHCIVAISPRHVTAWALSTGLRSFCGPSGIEFEITSVARVDDQYSIFVGTERGTIARLMLPGTAVVAHKQVSESEISSLKWVAGARYLACSLGDTGSILVLRSENLDKVYALNHWRSTQCVLNQTSTWTADTTASKKMPPLSEEDLFVPVHLRSFFESSELGWLKKLFVSAVASSYSTQVDSEHALEVLDSVIPSFSDVNLPGFHSRLQPASTMTFAGFLEEVKRRIELLEAGRGSMGTRKKLCELSSLDINASALQIVSGSSTNGSFCVWNLLNGSVLTAGHSTSADPEALDVDQHLAQVCCLDPLPYFALLSGNTRSSISIWLSAAHPPAFPRPFERIVEYEHGLQETEGDRNPRRDAEQADAGLELGAGLVTTMAWHFQAQSDDMLIAVGDDKGIITLYDFAPVHSLVVKSSSEDPATTLALSTRFSAVRGWQTDEPTPFRSMASVTSTQNALVTRPRGEAAFILLSDSGSISIWSIHGQCLGKLVDHLGPHAVPSQSPWRLGGRGAERVDTTQERLCSGAIARMEAASEGSSLGRLTKRSDASGTPRRDAEEEDSSSRDVSVVSGKARVRSAILRQLMSQ